MSENIELKEIRTWTSKGPGRKQCPSCQLYVGVRSRACPSCEHTFGDSSSVEKEKIKGNVFDGPGPGRKLCPGCKSYVGARCLACPQCEHDFTAKAPSDLPTPSNALLIAVPTSAPLQSSTPGSGHLVITPSGKCPVKLSDTTERAVRAWADQLIAAELPNRMSVDALEYWARDTYSYGTREHRIVCNHLRQIYDTGRGYRPTSAPSYEE